MCTLEKARQDMELIESVRSLLESGALLEREQMVFDAMDFSQIGQRIVRGGMGYGPAGVRSTSEQYWTLATLDRDRLTGILESHHAGA